MSNLLLYMYVHLFAPFLAAPTPVPVNCDLASGLRPGIRLISGNFLGLSTFGQDIVVVLVVLVVFTIATRVGRQFLSAVLYVLAALMFLGWFMFPILGVLVRTSC